MINKLLNKTVAILGLGKTGMAVARELKIRGVHVIGWDDKEELRKEASKIKVVIQDLKTVDFSTVDLLIISPGIPHTYPEPHPVAKMAKEHGVRIISDVELFVSSYKDAHYIGVTGTNGKSTTTALIYRILKENEIPCAIGGNFGIPVFDLPILGSDGYYVLEMSSYQIELSPSIDFDISILLNITPDHLSRHNGMAGYVSVKKQIFNRSSGKSGVNIVAVDDSYTKKIFTELNNEQPKSKNIPVSISKKIDGGYYVTSNGILIDNSKGEKKEIFDLKELSNLRGKHNWQNIVSAFVAVKKVGLSTSKIIASIKSFKTLEHRVENVGTFAGIQFIDDSKATNAESVKYAIDSLTDIYWIIGGRQKEGGIDILKPQLGDGKIKRVFVIGECEKVFYNDTKNVLPSYRCHKLPKAVYKAFKLALKDLKKGKVKNPIILLSPATASFDQYKSFEERGDHFKSLFNEIKEKYAKKLG
ncbi:MAG: UDP-N-acetylmuramoyl-L-alanine--D-glutamate ligase [Alphaproteobacteria bacterium]|nr:UDP-N-acetylmuramoyl-L-alanine--D-glutamate ligase [Alphaproteobacteria bacterium]